MTRLNTEEQNLICLYDPGTREGLMYELRDMLEDSLSDDDGFEEDAESLLKKLENMTDEEYFEVEKALAPFYPLEEESYWDDYSDEDSAFGWSDDPDWDEYGPDDEIE